MKNWDLLPDEFEKCLIQSLALDLPYGERRGGAETQEQIAKARHAAVLILFGYSSAPGEKAQGPSLLYTQRTDTVMTHKGQMAFPGGHCEPHELEGPVITALRETEEEVGISRDLVHVVGRIPSLLTITGYWIQPYVGLLKCSIEEAPLILEPEETAGAYWFSLQELFHPDTYRREMFAVGPIRYPIDVFQIQDHRIWGATGAMTKNLLDRLTSIR